MGPRLSHGALAIVLGTAALNTGCSRSAQSAASTGAPPPPKSAPAPSTASAPPPTPEVSNARVSDRPGNTKGAVFVVMYHHVLAGKTTMHRSPADFRRDLERFYKLGFRPVTVSQYLENKMPLPPGASPMVFTFDDSNPSQIAFRPDGTLDPNSAVGIWQEFAKNRPDFPVRATFYVLPDVMWAQPQFVKQKIALLRSLGSELASHTMTHPILRRMPDEAVKREIGEADARLVALGGTSPFHLAYPFGSTPKNSALLKGFDWKGRRVVVRSAVLVGANPGLAPTDPRFDRYRIPRIQANAEPYGIEYWLKRLEQGQVKPYVQP